MSQSSPGSNAEIQLENEHFRVTQWTIEPGGVIPMHVHDYEYVVVPLVTGSMHVVQADGSEFEAELELGKSYSRPRGSEHRIENRHHSNVVTFVEVERLG